MEAFLHYVWEHRRWDNLVPEGILKGCSVEVIDPGLCNKHAGPDFLEAKIRIDDITWVGSVEIHHRASEWYEHGHHTDPAYRGTIVHVVELWDQEIATSEGRLVPCLVMRTPEELRQKAESLIARSEKLACAPLGQLLEDRTIEDYMQKLSLDRLQSKAEKVQLLAEAEDWHEALYISLMRYHGFSLNNDAMELLARSLPYKVLARYVDRPLQFRSLVFGQSALLSDVSDEHERVLLDGEYTFLRRKHELHPIDKSLWKRLRTRPASFPLKRLEGVMSLLLSGAVHPSSVLIARSVSDLRSLFPTGSRSSADSLIINVALPYQYAWDRTHGELDNQYYREILEALPRESNKITRLFSDAGILARNARETQALVHLYKEYCLRRKCIYCHWGRILLSR